MSRKPSSHDGNTRGTLTQSLLNNCQCFAEEALSKAILAENVTRQWKFAILHICQAVELSLKARLHMQHPALIRKNIDSNDGNTVAPHIAIERLQSFCDVMISTEDKGAINKAKLWRNNIVHHEFSFKIRESKCAFATIFGFLQSFHNSELGSPLSSHITPSIWQGALNISTYGEELFERAEARILEEKIGSDRLIICPRCARMTCVLRDEETCTCYTCDFKDELIECEKCERLIPACEIISYKGGIEEDEMYDCFICSGCYHSGIESHIQHMINLRR